MANFTGTNGNDTLKLTVKNFSSLLISRNNANVRFTGNDADNNFQGDGNGNYYIYILSGYESERDS
jgi:hypothetical protein